MSTAAKRRKQKSARKRAQKVRSKFSAATADRHVLYQLSVQEVESEIDFVTDTFMTLRKRPARTMREDFCGTAQTSCEWVMRHEDNSAIGIDLDQATLDWGIEHNIQKLEPEQRARVEVRNADVLKNVDDNLDVILAMNFSYWCFKDRRVLVDYFKQVHKSLGREGVLFLDFYGGPDAHAEIEEPRKCDGFTYVWDQHKINPITGDMICRIHFEFPDGTKMKSAFEYKWRLWTLPEIRDVLSDAGFSRTIVYWEGDDGDGGGNGEFEPTEIGEACDAFIGYMGALK